MPITREILRSYFQNNFDLDIQNIDDSTKLFSGGLLDSFSVVDLLDFIEEQGNFIVEPEEVTHENIDSIANILAYTKLKSEAVSG